MDFHTIDRIINMLNYVTPQDVMIKLVEDDGMTPARAHVIICAAQLCIKKGC